MKKANLVAVGLGAATVTLGTGAVSLIIAGRNKRRVQKGDLELKGQKVGKVMKAVGLGAAIIAVAASGTAMLSDEESNDSNYLEDNSEYETYNLINEDINDGYDEEESIQLEDSISENKRIMNELLNATKEDEVF